MSNTISHDDHPVPHVKTDEARPAHPAKPAEKVSPTAPASGFESRAKTELREKERHLLSDELPPMLPQSDDLFGKGVAVVDHTHDATARQVAAHQAVDAARRGDLATLKTWLEQGGDPNQHDVEGWTALLAAAVRGQAGAVELLLDNPYRKADPGVKHAVSGALPIHFAGHSGSVRVAELILARNAGQLDAVWPLNGHTLLLQAAFYGHLDLARFALERGANTAATTVRGLGAREMALQFQNQKIAELIAPKDQPAEAKAAWLKQLLHQIAPVTPPDQREAQAASDALVAAIEQGLREVATDAHAGARTLEKVRKLVEHGAEVNRLGGPLQQPALVVAVTGNNGVPPNPAVATLRGQIAEYLVRHGANPTVREVHPMAVDAFIRAAVFNHLEILQMMGRSIPPARLAEALNYRPLPNGMTALHDTVLRASTAGPDRLEGYLAQIRWAVESGAHADLEDFSGRTQRAIAEGTRDPESRRKILEALGG